MLVKHRMLQRVRHQGISELLKVIWSRVLIQDRDPALVRACRRNPLMCRFLDAGNDEMLLALRRPASKKRQGTKSREVRHRLSNERYGDLVLTPSVMVGTMLAQCDLDGCTQGRLEERNGHLGSRVDGINGRSVC